MSPPATPLVDAMAAAWRAGHAERVVALAARRSGADAEDEGVLTLLGFAQQATHRHAPAVSTFERLCALRPRVSAHWNNLGVACRQAGDFERAEQAFARALQLAPRDAGVHYNVGLLYLQQRRWPLAREALLEAVRMAPADAAARLQAARACHACGDTHGEAAMLDDVRDWPPQAAAQALPLAAMLAARGRIAQALRVLAEAPVAADSEAPAWRLRIAAQRVLLYERCNQLVRARAALGQVPLAELEALPEDAREARVDGWRAHAAVAMRDAQYPVAAALYGRALAQAADPESRAGAAFGLAAACDREGLHDVAWRALETAHAAQCDVVAEVAPGLLAADGQPLSLATGPVDAGAFARWTPLAAPDAAHSPVFVIGFPRSGTTLLEQMLDAHPAFRSMDERDFVHELIERVEHAGQRYPDDLATLSQADADELRTVYFDLVQGVLPDRGGARLVDKNPLNMLCLPMIARLFPRAPVILCLRHPCDVLFSCSMQPFRSPAFMALCASLPYLARGYADAFERCCAELAVFKPHLLEWRYEAAVADLPGAAGRLGRFLGVREVAPMLDFAAHALRKGFIATPSYARVTRAVDRSAVGRWRAYQEHFAPVLPVLRPWIERFGYRP